MAKTKTKKIYIDDNSGEIIINKTNLNIFVKITHSSFRPIGFERNKYYDNNERELEILRGVEFFKMLLLGKYITKREYLVIMSGIRQLELVRERHFRPSLREEEDLERDYFYGYSR